jgi:hypothetical protein
MSWLISDNEHASRMCSDDEPDYCEHGKIYCGRCQDAFASWYRQSTTKLEIA